MSNIVNDNLKRLLDSGESFALITVVKAKGSTPRGAGTKMLVDRLGRSYGTIGGGCPESEAWQEAKIIASSGGYCLLDINLNHTGDVVKDGGEAMICGGSLEVFIEHIKPETDSGAFLRRALEAAFNQDKSAVNIVCTGYADDAEVSEKDPSGERFLYLKGKELCISSDNEIKDEELLSRLKKAAEAAAEERLGRLITLDYKDRKLQFFIDPMLPCRRFFIAGAGHVSRPLSAIASMCGFAVTVNDDRPEYADSSLFADGVKVCSMPFSRFFSAENLSLDEDCAVVLVTRGHKHDEECLRALAERRLGYLGMIGSRRRTILIRQRLLDDGISAQWVSKVHAPIGLDIGAETPEEIAVAVMAEVIAEFNGASALKSSLSSDEKLKIKASSSENSCCRLNAE